MEVEQVRGEPADELLEVFPIRIRGIAHHRNVFPEVLPPGTVGRRQDRTFNTLAGERGGKVADIDFGSADRVGEIEADAVNDAQAHGRRVAERQVDGRKFTSRSAVRKPSIR